MTRMLLILLVLVLGPWRQAAAQSSTPPEPSRTRLLLGPTGRALEQGQFYVDFSGFVGGPFAQVGITDRVSIGAGTPVLIPGIRPGDAVVVTPKVQLFSGRRVDAAVGALHFTGRRASDAGIAYAVVTSGSADAAVTGGVGFTYGSVTSVSRDRAPVVMLSGEKRLTRRLKIISENYAGFGGGLVCAGVRMTRRRGTLDLGLATLLGTEYRIVAPVFRFAWSL